MNLNFSINFNPTAARKLIARYYRVVIGFAVLVLVGFTGYQLSRVVAVQPDAAYLTIQEQTVRTPSLRSSKTVLLQLQKLQSAGSTTNPVTVGKQDPFSLSN